MHPGWKKNYFRYKSIFLNVAENYERRPDIKVYLELIMSLVTISVFAIFALRPTLLTISRLYKEIDSKKSVLEELNLKVSNLKEASEIYNDHIDNLELVYMAVPKNPESDLFSASLYSLALSSSVKLNGLSVNEHKIKSREYPKDQEQTIEVAFSTQGSYQNLIGFIKQLENVRRSFLIDNITLNQIIEKDGTKVTNLSLNGFINFVQI